MVEVAKPCCFLVLQHGPQVQLRVLHPDQQAIGKEKVYAMCTHTYTQIHTNTDAHIHIYAGMHQKLQ